MVRGLTGCTHTRVYVCGVHTRVCGVCMFVWRACVWCIHTCVHSCGAHAYLCGVCTRVCVAHTRTCLCVCLCVMCACMSGRLSCARVCPHMLESVHLPHLVATWGSALGQQCQPGSPLPRPPREVGEVAWSPSGTPKGLCSAYVCGACVYLHTRVPAHTHVLRARPSPAGRLHHPCRPRLPAGHRLSLGERAPHPALRGGCALQLREVPGRTEAGWFCGLWGWGGSGAGRGRGKGGLGPWEPLPILLGSWLSGCALSL